MNERNHYCKEVDVQLGRRISTGRQVAPKEALCVVRAEPIGAVDSGGTDPGEYVAVNMSLCVKSWRDILRTE